MQSRNIKLGTADVTLVVRLFDATNGSPKTGLIITYLQIRYIRNETDNDITISVWQSLIALAALTDAHADNKGYEIGEGYYRIDIPDAVCATGVNEVIILVQDSVGNSILVEQYQILPDEVNLTKILGTAVTEGAAGRLAAAFIKFGDVETPVFTAENVNQTGNNFPSVATAAAYAIVNSGLGFRGAVSAAVPASHQFTIPTLAGLGQGIFADLTAPYVAFVLRDAGEDGDPPQGETQIITAYDSVTGTFTTEPFTVPVAANDDIIIMHPRIAELAEIKEQTDKIPDGIVTAIFAKTGITAGGTWTFLKMLKVHAAWSAGRWRDKSGVSGTYEVLDPDDDTTVILNVTPKATTPQRVVVVMI